MIIVSESGSNPGVPSPHADLVAVLGEFANLDRYSRQREEVLKQLVDMIYAVKSNLYPRNGRMAIRRMSGFATVVP